jgi:hypothetical protein
MIYFLNFFKTSKFKISKVQNLATVEPDLQMVALGAGHGGAWLYAPLFFPLFLFWYVSDGIFQPVLTNGHLYLSDLIAKFDNDLVSKVVHDQITRGSWSFFLNKAKD